ncbi:hypothetical protein B0T21DRAFT_106547 [Apiosordaria backusii]|uniref:Uncharacterized protein n=1 Tax=Apiosordaria backusii TaxID=314023 RepID=A0AA39ZVB3_9PEZI|nr:hypothetical protein B0T21DRAFT_106547 [Apiosordaria backusii]
MCLHRITCDIQQFFLVIQRLKRTFSTIFPPRQHSISSLTVGPMMIWPLVVIIGTLGNAIFVECRAWRVWLVVLIPTSLAGKDVFISVYATRRHDCLRHNTHHLSHRAFLVFSVVQGSHQLTQKSSLQPGLVIKHSISVSTYRLPWSVLQKPLHNMKFSFVK